MRIPGVLFRGDDRRRVADEPFLGKPAGHQLLDLELGGRLAVLEPPRRFVEGAILYPIQLFGRGDVSPGLCVVPDGGELLDEVARGGDLDVELPHELDRAGVDARDVGDGALRRVLHRDPLHALEQALQPRFERGAAGVAFGGPGQMLERVRLDGVHQGARLAGRGDEVVPAPRGEVPALPADAGDVHRDSIDAVEVVQQPPVEPLRAQGRLHRPDVERRCR